jgi:hypothetical protein
MTRKCREFLGRLRPVPSEQAALTPGFQGIDGFALDQHRDEFLDTSRPGLGLLGGVDAVKDRVAVPAVERFEETSRPLAVLERGAEIIWNLRRALRSISGVPAPVLFRAFDLLQPRGLHATQFNELKRPGTVYLGPFAVGLTRGKADQPVLVIETVELAIDPAMAKPRIDRLLP